MFKTKIDSKIKDIAPGAPKEYSQFLSKIAQGLGVSKQQLRNIRNCTSIPNGKQLKWLADFFNCTIDDLVVGEEEPHLAAAA